MASRRLEVSRDGVLHDVRELHHVHRLVSGRRRGGSVASHVTTSNNNNGVSSVPRDYKQQQ